MPHTTQSSTYICAYICTYNKLQDITSQARAISRYITLLFCLHFSLTVGAIAQTPDSAPQEVAASPPSRSRQMIVITGAAGEETYVEIFKTWSERWVSRSKDSFITCNWIDGTQAQDVAGETESQSDKKRLLELITNAGDSELWLVMIGHGTFDGKMAKFNLRGEDISAEELATALSVSQGPQILIHCFSCSGAFLPVLSRPNRIVITATKSGAEMNYSRFGDYLSSSISDPSADLDHDNSVSILEAFLMAAKRTEQFYVDDRRLATEHPLLEDGGDGKGVSASFFRGIRQIKQAAEGGAIDGELAAMTLLQKSQEDSLLSAIQLQRRDELELALRKLGAEKLSMSPEEYYGRMAPIALELAEIYGLSTTPPHSTSP